MSDQSNPARTASVAVRPSFGRRLRAWSRAKRLFGEKRRHPKLTPLQELKRKVQITKDARFQAHRRLERRHHYSSYLISLLSLYVIALSLYPNIFSLTPQQSQLLLAGSVVLSVFIIILSLSEGARNFYHKGEVLHDNARILGQLHNKLELLSEADPDLINKISSIAKDYEAAIDRCPTNHDNVDYLRVKLEKPWLFSWYFSGYRFFDFWYRRFVQCKCFLSEFSWVILPGAFVVLITFVLINFLLNAPVQSAS